MANLYLLRHAKSAWDDLSVPDYDRRLARRGSHAIGLMAQHLRAANVAPDLVLCSSARRAVQTLDGIRAAFPEPVSTSIEDQLYAATADELLARLRQLPGSPVSVLLIGHNPGLQELGVVLAGRGNRRMRMQLRGKLPTGALVTLAVPTPWRDLTPGCARLLGLVTPHDLG
jgi:phosphohistidine phosphatase